MKLLSGLTEVSEFHKTTVHIRDAVDLLHKLNKLIEDGHEKLQIVTDFDYTLTRNILDNGNAVLTSFGMFRECPSVPQYYRDEEIRLASKYRPIESDPHISTEDKTKHMIDWYVASFELLKGLKFPKNELPVVADRMVECFRRGVRDMFEWSKVKQTPVLVFSAGLGESVTAALKAANFLLPNVKVVSNFLAMDENDKIIGVSGEIIHTHNKNASKIKHSDYYGMVQGRCNAILIGDNIGDAGMTEGMDQCDTVLKVGFLGQNAEPNIKMYLNKFDIVLVNDPTFDIVNAMLRLIL